MEYGKSQVQQDFIYTLEFRREFKKYLGNQNRENQNKKGGVAFEKVCRSKISAAFRRRP